MDTEKKKAEFLQALKEKFGIIAIACKKAGIGRRTYYNWRDADQEFAGQVQDVMEEQIDFVEGKLLQLINEGDTTATIFYLKTRGRERGYGNKLLRDEANKPKAEPAMPTETAPAPTPEQEIQSEKDFKKKVEAKQKYLVKLLREQNKYTPELSMQAKVVAQLLVRTDVIWEQVSSAKHQAVSVEVSREGNAREKISELENLALKYSEQSQRALKALGMNTDAKERKSDGGKDTLQEFMDAIK